MQSNADRELEPKGADKGKNVNDEKIGGVGWMERGYGNMTRKTGRRVG